MTNEEASFILANIDRRVCDDELSDALDVAIKALEAQPAEDCISREQAKDAMYALCDETETLEDNPWRENPHIDAIIDEIDNLPSVTPKAKVGHWIDIQYFKADDTYYRPKCPFCGIEPKEYSNYCPECGARMEEVEE